MNAEQASLMDAFMPDVWPTFNDWWSLYDYKLDRKRCERLWAKMSQRDRETAMQHTERYVTSTFTDGQFPSRRHPGTYLHNENWNDEALIRIAPKPATKLASAVDRAEQYFASRPTFADGKS